MINSPRQILVKVSSPKGIIVGLITALSWELSVSLSEHLPRLQQGFFLAPTLDFLPVETRHRALVHNESSPQGRGEMWPGAQLQAECVHCCSPQRWQSDPPPEGKPLEEIHISAMEFIPWVTLMGYPSSYYEQQQCCCSRDKLCFPFLLTVH